MDKNNNLQLCLYCGLAYDENDMSNIIDDYCAYCCQKLFDNE